MNKQTNHNKTATGTDWEIFLTNRTALSMFFIFWQL